MVMREYEMRDFTEHLEELEEIERDESEDELDMVAGAVMTVEKKLSVEGSSVERKVSIKCKKNDTCSSSSEIEPDESVDEVPAMGTTKVRPRSEDIKDNSGPV